MWEEGGGERGKNRSASLFLKWDKWAICVLFDKRHLWWKRVSAMSQPSSASFLMKSSFTVMPFILSQCMTAQTTHTHTHTLCTLIETVIPSGVVTRLYSPHLHSKNTNSTDGRITLPLLNSTNIPSTIIPACSLHLIYISTPEMQKSLGRLPPSHSDSSPLI